MLAKCQARRKAAHDFRGANQYASHENSRISDSAMVSNSPGVAARWSKWSIIAEASLATSGASSMNIRMYNPTSPTALTDTCCSTAN